MTNRLAMGQAISQQLLAQPCRITKHRAFVLATLLGSGHVTKQHKTSSAMTANTQMTSKEFVQVTMSKLMHPCGRGNSAISDA